jgi:hypothetical protein
VLKLSATDFSPVNSIVGPRAPFYSAVVRALETSRQSAASGRQWWATLSATRGVRKEELEWLGLQSWLAGRETISRERLLEFVREHQIQLAEIVKRIPKVDEHKREALDLVRLLREEGFVLSSGGPSELDSLYVLRGQNRYVISSDQDLARLPDGVAAVVRRLRQALREWQMERVFPMVADPDPLTARYASYTEPGGEFYRELLIVWPLPSTEALDARIRTISLWPQEPLLARRPAMQPELDRLNEAWNRVDLLPRFLSHNWRECNVVAHLRMTERVDTDGDRVLFLEEVQSDWHQTGRRRGHCDQERVANMTRLRWLVLELGERMLSLSEHAEIKELQERLATVAVPPAPFRSSWPELLLKRAVRWAVDRGIERLAWSEGEQQARRYGQIRRVIALRYEVSPATARMIELKGLTVAGYWVRLGDVSSSKLEQFVGREAAGLIRAGAGERASYAVAEGPNVEAPFRVRCGSWGIGEYASEAEAARALAASTTVRCLERVDLHVGGVSLRGLYDGVLPGCANAYLKKWGTQVRKGTLEFGGSTDPVVERKRVHMVDITPALRDAAMAGQPLFRRTLLAGGMPAARVLRVLNQTISRAGWAQCPSIRVVQSIQELPPAILGHIAQDSGRAPVGALIAWSAGRPTIFFIADHNATSREVIENLLHEVVGHWGLRRVMDAQRYTTLMDGIWRDLPERVRIAAARNGLDRDSEGHALDIATNLERRRVAAEEVIAYEAGRLLGGGFLEERVASCWSRLVEAIREFLHRIGFPRRFDERQIASVVREAYRAVARPSVEYGISAQTSNPHTLATMFRPAPQTNATTPTVVTGTDPFLTGSCGVTLRAPSWRQRPASRGRSAPALRSLCRHRSDPGRPVESLISKARSLTAQSSRLPEFSPGAGGAERAPSR